MKIRAVLPGSYDPVTRGHLDVIRRAAAVFGPVEVLVMDNREKKYRFSAEERLALCRAALEGEKDVSVSYFDGMLWEYMRDRRPGAVLVKGVRNGEDLAYERLQADFNFAHCGAETAFLDARDEFRELSSTRVREALSKNEGWEALVPEKIVTILRGKL